jgi:glycosyltransferase involved in cell wall biosynthesis
MPAPQVSPTVARRPVAARLPGLSVVLPCLDEEDNVADAVREATVAAQLVADAHEILVVDDGSHDRTRARAEALAAADPRVRVLVHDANRGYGAAMRSGLGAARMPWVLLTDADLQFDLTDLRSFLAPAAHHDLLMGYRIVRMDALHRRVNAAAWNALVRHVFAVPVRDVDCAFKLLRRSALDDVRLTADGAMISPELVAALAARGARITELAVHHRPRHSGHASGASPRVVLRAFAELRRIRTRTRAEAASADAGPPALVH